MPLSKRSKKSQEQQTSPLSVHSHGQASTWLHLQSLSSFKKDFCSLQGPQSSSDASRSSHNAFKALAAFKARLLKTLRSRKESRSSKSRISISSFSVHRDDWTLGEDTVVKWSGRYYILVILWSMYSLANLRIHISRSIFIRPTSPSRVMYFSQFPTFLSARPLELLCSVMCYICSNLSTHLRSYFRV